jgi:hypothetical protein
VERSLVAGGERDSVEFLRRRVRQMATPDFCAVAEESRRRKVTAMLGDHSAEANTTVLVFLFDRTEL